MVAAAMLYERGAGGAASRGIEVTRVGWKHTGTRSEAGSVYYENLQVRW